jgi:uncharacterized protein (UPF0332 family)
MNPGLDRARAELVAAQLLTSHGLPGQAVTCAFQAARHATEAALLVLGETRSEPAQVVPAAVRRLVHERGLDPEAGRLLRSLSNRCRYAEHSYDPVPAAEAAAAIQDATVVVDALAAWLDAHLPGGNGRSARRPGRPVRRRR